MQQLLNYLTKKGIDEEEVKPYLETINKELNGKKYGLVWEDQQENILVELESKFPILKEISSMSIKDNEDHPTHIIMEGDNIESLYILNYTHKESIDLIYIDPPYNLGRDDFTYNDKMVDVNDAWKHSKWLSFMNQRLRLAHSLLKKEGLIFINIDEHEMAQLKLLCDEIFGESNFIGDMPRKTKSSTNDIGNNFNIQHDHILIYGKTSEAKLKGIPKSTKEYSNPDNDPNGIWKSSDPSARSGGAGTYFEIVNPYTNRVDLPPSGRYWAFSQETLEEYIEKGRVKFKEDYPENERGFIFKTYFKDLRSQYNALESLRFVDNDYMNQAATRELNRLDIEFDYPKPVKLIKDIIDIATHEDAIILDFFAGSGTTGQAVLELNNENGGNRQFILCTNNEVGRKIERQFLRDHGYLEGISHKRFKTTDKYKEIVKSDEYQALGICRAITYPRISKIMNGYTNTDGTEVGGLDGNLRYYRTRLVDDYKETFENAEQLIDRCTEIISIKEGCYEVTELAEEYTILENNSKIVIVFRKLFAMDYDLEKVSNEISEIKKEKFLYTTNVDYQKDGFVIKEYPQEIMDLYNKLRKTI